MHMFTVGNLLEEAQHFWKNWSKITSQDQETMLRTKKILLKSIINAEEKRRKEKEEDKSYESLDGIRSQGDHLFLFFFVWVYNNCGVWGWGLNLQPLERESIAIPGKLTLARSSLSTCEGNTNKIIELYTQYGKSKETGYERMIEASNRLWRWIPKKLTECTINKSTGWG